MKQRILILLPVLLLAACKAEKPTTNTSKIRESSFEQTADAYPAPGDLEFLLAQKFEIALPIECNNITVASQKRALGLNDPVTGQTPIRTPNAEFVRLLTQCVLKLSSETQVRRNKGLHLKNWKTLSLLEKKKILSDLTRWLIGPGVLADQDKYIERIGKRTQLLETRQNASLSPLEWFSQITLTLILSDEFLRIETSSFYTKETP